MYRKLIAKRNAQIVKMFVKDERTVEEIASIWDMKPREVRGAIRRGLKAQ